VLMASESSNSITMTPAVPLLPISEKLTQVNFPVWKALVLLALRGAQLQDFLSDKVVFSSKELTLEDKKMTVPNHDPLRGFKRVYS
jgi:hypothetical protein